MPAPTDLTDLRISRISLLVAPKEPANRLKIPVAKAQQPGDHGGPMPKPEDEIKLAATPEVAAVLKDATTAQDDEAGLEAELHGYNAQHRAGVLAMRRIFGKLKPQMAKDLLAKLPMLLGFEMPAADKPAGDPGTPPPGAPAPVAASAAPSIDGVPLEPVVKADGSLDLTGIPAEKVGLAKALWDKELRVRKLERERLRAVHVAKAATMPRLGAADEVGELLCDLAERLPAPTFDKVLAKFAQADALIAKGGVFSERGSNRDAEPADDDPMGKLRAKARQIVKDSGGKMSEADALDQVLRTADGDALYREQVDRQRSGARA